MADYLEAVLLGFQTSVWEPLAPHYNHLVGYAPEAIAKFAQENPLFFIVFLAIVLGMVVSTLLKPSNLASRPTLMAVNTNVTDVARQADLYTRIHRTDPDALAERKAQYKDMVNAYYSLSTDFYEFGWGESFHFAHRYPHESREESIVRHEYWLSAQLGLKPGMRVIDLGCGVGGPARNIARFSRAHVTGLTLNAYQVERANAKTAAAGLDSLVAVKQGDFMAPPFPDATFDAAYAIEATCHAPDRTACFAQVFRMLKPGSVFAGYEWVTTDKYNPADPEHREIKHGIEIGDGLPDITDGQAVLDALTGAGFEVEEYSDLAPESPVPWYEPFQAEYTLKGFKLTALGIWLTHVMVVILEFLRIAPTGTSLMHHHLSTAARTLTASGEKGIFTPMFFFKARKPLSGKASKAAVTASAAINDHQEKEEPRAKRAAPRERSKSASRRA